MSVRVITGSPVAARGASPVDLKDAAAEPVEAASCEQAGSTSGSGSVCVGDEAVPMATDVTMLTTSEDQTGPVITQSMLDEEKLLHEKTLHQEEEMKHKREEAIAQWDEDIREQRYKRLEFLLSKSQMYTSYLVERMKNQAAEEEKRKARREKRTARETEKKNKEASSVQQQPKNNGKDTAPSTTEDAITKSVEKLETVPEEICTENPAEPTPQVAPARRRSSRRACLSTNSSSNKPQKTGSGQTAKTSGRSRKRKQPEEDEVENFKISDYFNEALARSKRQKTEKTDKGGDDRDHSGDDKNGDAKKNEKTNEASAEAEKIAKSENSEPESEAQVNATSGKEQPDASAALTVRQFQGQPIPDGQPELFTGGILRQYQIDGFSWLRVLYENGVNGILADEMGLGKTIQCIALISHLVQYGVTGPFLVCAPLSTVPNWVSEFANFAPKVPVILYHGKKEERVFLRRQMNKKVKVDNNWVHPVVITSYEISMNDRKYMQHLEWKYLIVDEGHRIKNFQCKLIRELKLYRSTHRLLLTGTPLQNNLAELWSLLNFLLPEIFDDLGSFEAWFDIDYLDSDDGHEMIVREEQRNSVLSMLHQILMPFMLRRLKTDVCLAIPPKREVLVYAPLMKEQDEIYRAVINKTIKAWVDRKQGKDKVTVELDEKGRPKRRAAKQVSYETMLDMEDDSKEQKEAGKKLSDEEKADAEENEMESWVNSVSEWQRQREQWNSSGMEQQDGLANSELNIQLRNTLWILRKSCNHPYLVEYPLTAGGQFKIDEGLVKCSGKLMLLDKMLQSLKREGHKVLLFSQMTSMLDILEDYCFLRKYGFCRLDGSTSLDERRDQIQDFNKDPERFIFLLSTRAGGLGINLTAADTVVIFDSDWNPQCDLQAQDRCHRIGQTRPVMVYRLVTSNTIDQRIVERAASKRRLEKIVIHKGKFKEGMGKFSANSLAPLTPQELIKLLKSTDYDDVVKGSGEDVITEGDLQKLLDRDDLCRLWKQRQSSNESSDETKEEGGQQSSPLPTTTDKRDIEGVFKVISEDIGGGGEPNTEKKNTSPHTLFSEMAKTAGKDTDTEETKEKLDS